MNPAEAPQVHKIEPECQPVFPCWLWFKRVHPNSYWARYYSGNIAVLQEDFGATHWHPDQPSAPTVRPTTAGFARYHPPSEGLPDGHYSDPHSPASKGGTAPVSAERGIPQQWAKEAARLIDDRDTQQDRIASIIAKHAPHPRETEGKGSREKDMMACAIHLGKPYGKNPMILEDAFMSGVSYARLATAPSSASLPESEVERCAEELNEGNFIVSKLVADGVWSAATNEEVAAILRRHLVRPATEKQEGAL